MTGPAVLAILAEAGERPWYVTREDNPTLRDGRGYGMGATAMDSITARARPPANRGLPAHDATNDSRKRMS